MGLDNKLYKIHGTYIKIASLTFGDFSIAVFRHLGIYVLLASHFFGLILIPLYKIRRVCWNGSKEISRLRQGTCQNTAVCNIVMFVAHFAFLVRMNSVFSRNKKHEDLSALCNPLSYYLRASNSHLIIGFLKTEPHW